MTLTNIAFLALIGVLAAVAGFFVARWLAQCRSEEVRRRRAHDALVLSKGPGMRRLPGRLGAGSRRVAEERALALERHVPEMIDAVALGMRAGMSFEAAFRLYCERFDDELALKCRSACRSWESGLVLRDDALAALAAECGVPSLTRFVGNAVRCLRFGSPMGRMLEVLSGEARACYRAKMEEKVAKAPVKMLMPTAALILPAMLIMVLAPVLLEFL